MNSPVRYSGDLSTLPDSRGHGDTLMHWIRNEAVDLECEAVQLNSGVSLERAPAHRLYIRQHLAITAHHFTLGL